MRIIAPMMILIMMTSTLAGCTGGDPDGGGNDEIDMDILNQLIDDNLQDFINNTTITVENHYHNNTTVMNDNTDNSVSNINGSTSSSVMKMFTVEWEKNEYILESEGTLTPGEKMVTLTGTENSSGGGDNTLLFAKGYNGYTIEFRFTCDEYRHYYSNWEDEEWYDWLVDNYGSASTWQETDNLAEDIEREIYDNWRYGFDAEAQCYFSSEKYTELITLFEINIEQGEAISILSIDPNVIVDINCEDGYGTGIGNGTAVSYMGGQSDCVVSGTTTVKYGVSTIMSDVYDNYSQRYMYERIYMPSTYTFDYQVQSSFSVYFTSHIVEVYENEI